MSKNMIYVLVCVVNLQVAHFPLKYANQLHVCIGKGTVSICKLAGFHSVNHTHFSLRTVLQCSGQCCK